MNEKETLPRWEKTANLISATLEDPDLLARLNSFNREQKLEFLYNYGFTEDDLANLDEDLKVLSDSVLATPRWWL